MRKIILFTLFPLVVIGCATIRNSTSFQMKDARGVWVMGALGEPDEDWQCKKVGSQGYNPEDKTILGVDFKKDINQKEAEKREDLFFIMHAIKFEANYVDIPFSHSSGFGDIYMSSDTVYADYYQCKNLPQPSTE